MKSSDSRAVSPDSPQGTAADAVGGTRQPLNRRSFLQHGALAGAAAMLPAAGLLSVPKPVFADDDAQITEGDVAILRFLAAAELIETDLWQQYCELAVGNPGYHDALSNTDASSPTYACDTTDDERSHAAFINAFLESVGASPVNLDPFRKLPPVNVKGSDLKTKRLTNLTHLNVDTSWFLRYRSEMNPDLGATFPQLVNIVGRPAIPTSDTLTAKQLQVIADTADFHFCTIEQGGSSLYMSLITKVTSVNVLRILAGIGPVEMFHFATFEGSLENLAGLDSGDGLVFPDLKNMPDLAVAVMPEPTQFFDKGFPLCSVVRPTSNALAGARAAVSALTQSGLFEGQSPAFSQELKRLANAADAAQRGVGGSGFNGDQSG